MHSLSSIKPSTYRFTTIAFSVFLFARIAIGQITPDTQPVTPPTGTESGASPAALIGGGDLLEVTVYGTDFNRQVRVSEAGEVSLPLLGTVKLGGLTIARAEQLVSQQLEEKGYFTKPQVSILDREYATQGISVLGEVQKPGIYTLLGSRTLFDAISAAGGTTEKAGSSAVITHRDRPDTPQTVPLSYVADRSKHSNVPLFPGDTVVVSKAGIVYVVGDVHKPSGIVMQSTRMTALQAVAMAEGVNSTAALDSAKVIRKTPDGLKEIPLPLKKILAAKAPDWQLQADDILFVPTSAAKVISRRGLEAIIQAATGAAIYRPY